jgi:hypothetical protein
MVTSTCSDVNASREKHSSEISLVHSVKEDQEYDRIFRGRSTSRGGGETGSLIIRKKAIIGFRMLVAGVGMWNVLGNCCECGGFGDLALV